MNGHQSGLVTAKGPGSGLHPPSANPDGLKPLSRLPFPRRSSDSSQGNSRLVFARVQYQIWQERPMSVEKPRKRGQSRKLMRAWQHFPLWLVWGHNGAEFRPRLPRRCPGIRGRRPRVPRIRAAGGYFPIGLALPCDESRLPWPKRPCRAVPADPKAWRL